MITRGYYIGEIIDELAIIAEQVYTRGKLHLFDLNTYVEQFFCDYLNLLLNAKLKNLNELRSNTPGLDLGDEDARIAFQITSHADGEKVNTTLEKITEEQAKKYDNIYILAVGYRQGKYGTLNEELVAKYNFGEKNIWDVHTLTKKAMALKIDKLQELHRLVRDNTARLRIDLEIPDQDGKYPTSGYEEWEERVKPKIGTGQQFLEYLYANRFRISESESLSIPTSIRQLAQTLAQLPRITREFLAMLFERRENSEPSRNRRATAPHVLFDKVKREYRGDFDGELALLERAGLITIEKEDVAEHGPAEIFLSISDNDNLLGGFLNYVNDSNLSFRNVIGSIDFSSF